MEMLNSMWWGGGLLSAAHDGDVARLMQVLARCERGDERVVQCPGMAVHIEGETDARRARRLREAAVNYKNDDGFQAIHMAVSEGHVPMMVALHKEGADVNSKVGYGRTCLHLALEHCSVEAIECLLSLGCDPELTNRNGRTAVQIAEAEMLTNDDTKTQLQTALDEMHDTFATQLKTLHKELEQYLVSCDDAEKQLYLRVLGQGGEQGDSPKAHSVAEAEGSAVPSAAKSPLLASDGDSNGGGGDGNGGGNTSGGNYGGENGSDSEEEGPTASKSRTMRQVLIEIEDLETDYTTLVAPLQKRLVNLEERNVRLRAVIALIQGFQNRGAQHDSDGGEAESSDAGSDPQDERTRALTHIFHDHAQGHDTITFPQMLEIYEDALVAQFGDLTLETESADASLRRALQAVRVGRRGRNLSDEVDLDTFIAVIMRMENI